MGISQLTFLRFIAAIAVVVFHVGRDLPSLAWGMPFWQIADTAVSFFFFLSGFILMVVYASRSAIRKDSFYVARLARLVPVYLLALVATVPFAHVQGRLNALDFGLSALLIHAWVPGHSQVINTPGWSLSVELCFYLLFPFVFPWVARIKSSAALLLTMALLWAANLALYVGLLQLGAPLGSHSLWHELANYHPLPHVATFVTGMCAGVLFLRHRAALANTGVWLAFASFAVFAGIVIARPPVIAYSHNGLFTPFYALTIMGLGAAEKSWVARLFSLAPLVMLGEISYGIYILQMPVFQTYCFLVARLPFELAPDLHFYGYCLVLIAASYVTFRFLETPLRSHIQSLYARHFPGPLLSRKSPTT